MCVLFIPTRLQAKSQHISPDIYQQQRRRRKIPLCLVSVWYSQKMERMKMGIWRMFKSSECPRVFLEVSLSPEIYESFKFQLTYSHYIWSFLAIRYILMFMFCSYVTCFEQAKHQHLFIGIIFLFMHLMVSFSLHQKWMSILPFKLGAPNLLTK